jgi:hypothetical protein
MIALLVAAAAFISPLNSHRFADLVANPVCKPIGRMQVSAPVAPALLYRHGEPGAVKRLGTLPKANHEKAVLRTVDGCSAPVVVSYGVERDGRFTGGSAEGGK